MSADISTRVLSIQSHVVSGYCGNKSAVFPLQVLGFEVDFINSVQFSNHTWYKECKGQVLNDTDLAELMDALRANDLHHYSHVVTGYVGSEKFLLQVYDVVKELKKVNPGLTYGCDPVLGDDGVLYAPKELQVIYKEKMIHLADVIFPNQDEAELLSDVKITCEDDALNAMAVLHAKGPHTVVITSTRIGGQNKMIGYASTIRDGQKRVIRMEVPKLDAMFIGTGDLFASLWLAWSYVHGGDITLVARKVQSTMQTVIARTYSAAMDKVGADRKPTCGDLELKLIQSKRDIENPEICAIVQTIL